ncbi:MAG: putative metal-dependent hydrolase [Vicingaceae bacterium]|jgi:predicted metal-dependent hydrolase
MRDQIQYGNSQIDYSLEYAERKTLGIKVFPDKSVHVTAPEGSSNDNIREKVRSKAAWILRQQDFFLSFHPITPPRKFVSGETHLYLGRQYKLKIKQSEIEAVKFYGGRIEVSLQDKTDRDKVEVLLRDWYKSKALIHFESLFEKLVPMSKSFFEGEAVLKYRWMKKRWGSCDKDGSVHLNLELIKAPKKCIEYVIVHELCHLAHLNHSKAFYDLLEQFYPSWQKTKDELEKLMV